MDKFTMANMLDQYFFDLQAKATQDYKSKYNQAMLNEEFEDNENNLRSSQLNLSMAKARNKEEEIKSASQKVVMHTEKRLAILASLGIDLNYHYVCSACKDSGWIDGKSCTCRHARYLTLLKENCGLAPLTSFKFEHNNFSNIPVVQAKFMQILYCKMQEFCTHFDTTAIRQIFFSGEVGIGKTALASATINRLVELGKFALYISSYDINQVFLAKHTNSDSAKINFYSVLKDCDFLVIDDLGCEPVFRNVTLEYLFALIDYRILNGKKTMVCTNLTKDNFINRYGERALSRLTDKRYSIALTDIKGDDLRKIKITK